MEPRLVSTWNYKEAHGALLQAFNTVSTTETTLVSVQIRRYAAKCALYAQNRAFLTEFTKSFEARKLVIERVETWRNIESLASRSISTVVSITKGALSAVENSTLEILESSQNKQPRTNDAGKGKGKSNTYDKDKGEEIWRNLLDSTEPMTLGSPSHTPSAPATPFPIPPLLQFTPEKPKLTMQQLEQLDSTCNIAISNMPVSTLPLQLSDRFSQNRDQQLKLASLKSLPILYQHISQLLDDDDDDDNHEDFAFKVWTAEKAARSCEERPCTTTHKI
ncbi:hypothetical protein [Absidia glauca]|uniref:Uncharacterized protein n=1 Tax=Absidia glauca TaxID=4829 RepID=A0A163JNS7_ABSGL|nr:hypothetical protein [Absidia glauca]